jgi:hypothetical protein
MMFPFGSGNRFESGYGYGTILAGGGIQAPEESLKFFGGFRPEINLEVEDGGESLNAIEASTLRLKRYIGLAGICPCSK